MKHLMTFEKYYGYEDFNRKWGSPEEMMEEVEWVLSRLLPKKDMIKSIEDSSTDKGIKFTVTLKSKDILHLYKISQFRFQENQGWEYYFNKKKVSFNDLKSDLEKSNMSDLEVFLKYFKSYDFYAQYIDDGGQYKSAVNNNDSIVNRFNDLSSSDKKKAKKELLKHFKSAYKSKDIIDQVNSTFKS
tara:strand:+ start:2680 stop:3237 length:558 start_codon:yes stop_codon:yes gene_type:complete